MLQRLSIRDVVLIRSLELSFHNGLGVVTGETGAGKSILLDSLGLALGMRASSTLVRPGALGLAVSAEFVVAPNSVTARMLRERSLEVEMGVLTLRRVVDRDGRSRAYVNDQSVSVGLLRTLGSTLVELHGQFETQGLLNPATHRDMLDALIDADATACKTAWEALQAASDARQRAEADFEAVRTEQETLRHAEAELAALAPQAGEEDELSERHALLLNGEKLAEALNTVLNALCSDDGAETHLRVARKNVERIVPLAEGQASEALAALDRATIETMEARDILEHMVSELDPDPHALEPVEERLFSLRALARKHGCEANALSDVVDDIRAKLAAIEDDKSVLVALVRKEQDARQAYVDAAQAFSAARRAAATALDARVDAELPALKLEKAHFLTRIEELAEAKWSARGMDAVVFQVSINPGHPPGPIGQIASGGELARFMLALKMALSRVSLTPTLIFDEVDVGVGGATAAAVGDRLAQLAEHVQVLVITHSPQVAARGVHHMKATKQDGDGIVTVKSLNDAERREEVARMLSGAKITDHARAAAASLMRPNHDDRS